MMPRAQLWRRVKYLALGAMLVWASSGRSQAPVQGTYKPLRVQPATASVAGQSTATVVKMTLHPAAAPVPALKYHLLPEVRDLKPGNAALLYQRAHSPEWWGPLTRAGEVDRIGDWLEMPLRKMPRDKIVLPAAILKELDQAARKEYCDWEMTPRLREEGYALLIPDVQGFRTYGQMLALRARLEMLDGRLDQAIDSLQTGFALSRHVSEAPIIMNALVGMAVGNNMLNQVEELVQLEKAPNMYWALADLPRPLVNLRRPFQGEKLGIASAFPDLRTALSNPRQPPVPVPTINKYLENLRYSNNNVASSSEFRLMFTMMAARTHAKAKQHLLANGFSAEQINAMPVIQVGLMYSLELLDESFDEIYKWHGFPYWQAGPEVAKARKKFAQRKQEHPEAMFLATFMMPAMDSVIFSNARLERRLAMLRIVEALRLHAASEGRFADRLDDIHAVPIPIDPFTGKAFEYSLSDGRAVLYGPPPAGENLSERNATRYELTLAK